MRLGKRRVLRSQSKSLRTAPSYRLFRLEAAARRHGAQLSGRRICRGGVFANVYPFARGGSTEVLSVIHLPIALWFAVGMAYAGGRWNKVAGRMDFIRFSGELFIYYVLIALGGGVFTGFLMMLFKTIGVDASGSSNPG